MQVQEPSETCETATLLSVSFDDLLMWVAAAGRDAHSGAGHRQGAGDVDSRVWKKEWMVRSEQIGASVKRVVDNTSLAYRKTVEGAELQPGGTDVAKTSLQTAAKKKTTAK